MVNYGKHSFYIRVTINIKPYSLLAELVHFIFQMAVITTAVFINTAASAEILYIKPINQIIVKIVRVSNQIHSHSVLCSVTQIVSEFLYKLIGLFYH